jgi:hypothetical protein
MRTGQVFVSHTSDMAAFPQSRSFVQAVLDAVARAGMAAVDMRYFAARDRSPADYCRARVRACEIYVAVVGFRYGSIVPGEAVSYTELEFGEAGAAGLPRLVFLLENFGGLPPDAVDADLDLVEGFRQRLRTAGLIVGSFTTSDRLELQVFHALSELPDARPLAGAAPPAAEPIVVGEIPREPPGFVARDMLSALSDAAGRGPVAVVCAVTGLRGVGKTQLAAGYARDRVRAGWSLVGWVNAETPDTLLSGLAEVAERLGVADPQGDSLESARRLREHLQTRAGDGLLVFDNAASPDDLRPFLPAAGRTQIVITSTDQGFAELGDTVDVSAFTRPQSLAYLHARTGQSDPGGAAQVADAVGDLPLALAQAAATIRRQHLTYSGYLSRLRRVPVTDLLGAVPGGDYPHATAAAMLLSVQATEASDPTGLTSRLLWVLAVLSPDGTRRDLLTGLTRPSDPSGPGGADLHDYQVDRAIEQCAAGSLVTWSVTGDTVIMHRLLSRVLRERDHAAGQWPATVSTALDLIEPLLIPIEHAWARRHEGAQLINQTEALWDAAGSATTSPDQRRRQLRARSWAVRQLRATADLGRAIDTGTRVLADCEQILGPDDPDTLTARYDLAEARNEAGQEAAAMPLYERTLADRERVLGADNPDTLSSLSRLASVYAKAGLPDQAIPMQERALADYERVLGPAHPDTLSSRSDLAYAYREAGRLDEAIVLNEQNLGYCEQVLGPDHANTLLQRNSSAFAYSEAGRLDEAIALNEQNLADYLRIFGPDYPDTLLSRDNLGHDYRQAGRLDEAIVLHEQNLADYERILGPEHPDTLYSRMNLAEDYREAGRLDEAIALHKANLADYERVLGSEHPDTLLARHNLAQDYREAGRLDEAIALHEQNLADRTRILGLRHPHTVASKDHLQRVSAESRSR